MIIRIKKIEHERTEDAPFIGALICSIDCKFNCFNCFNQQLKQEPILYMDSEDVIKIVLEDKFNKGIILAGLEWTLQPEEMRELIKLALNNKLEVMIYTGLEENKFKEQFNDICNLDSIYIKFGKYKEDLKCNDNIQFGVRLASKNQKIVKFIKED